jgi:hypothetical protein
MLCLQDGEILFKGLPDITLAFSQGINYYLIFSGGLREMEGASRNRES